MLIIIHLNYFIWKKLIIFFIIKPIFYLLEISSFYNILKLYIYFYINWNNFISLYALNSKNKYNTFKRFE